MSRAKHGKKHGIVAFVALILVVAFCSVGVFFNGYVRRGAAALFGYVNDFINRSDFAYLRIQNDTALLDAFTSEVQSVGDIRALEIVLPERDLRSEAAAAQELTAEDGDEKSQETAEEPSFTEYSDYAMTELNVQLQYASANGFSHVIYKTSLYSKKDYDVLTYLRQETTGMGLKLIMETDLTLLHNAHEEEAFDAVRFTPVYETVRSGFWKSLFYPATSKRTVATSGIDPNWIYIADDGAKCLNPSYDEARDFMLRELNAALEKYTPDLLLLDAPKYNVSSIDESAILSNFTSMNVDTLHRRSASLLTLGTAKLIDESYPQIGFGVRGDGIGIGESVTSDYAKGTQEWCEKGYLDYVVIDNSDSMAANDNFITMLNLWKGIENATGVSFVCGYNANLINTTPEWSGFYELANEYDAAAKLGCVSGAFADYAALALHKDEAELLYMVFENTIDFGIADEELKLTSPADGITVDVPVIAVSGTCDNNVEIKINGNTVEPTERGFFAADITLSAGKNVITVEHKGKTITRTVNYNLVILKDITPTGELSVMGGSTVEYTVTARKGARVRGTLNGETVTFTEQPAATEGSSDEGVFVPFTGQFAIPEAKNEAYSLGTAKVTASYDGFVKSLKGASVTVMPTPEVVGNVAVIKADKAETFRAEPANSDTSLPQYYWLPKGTKDYIVGESQCGSDSSLSYYTLKCGLRVYQKDVTVEKSSIPANKTADVTLTDSGKYTYITFANTQRVPYKLAMNGLYSGDANTTTATVSSFSRIDITLFNSVGQATVKGGGTSLLSLLSSSSDATEQTVTYSFNLAKNGGFYGFTSYYDDAGKLVIRLRNPIKASGGRLDGIKICLDAGHGGVDSGATGISGVHEADENLKVAKALKAKFESLGATVVMTRTNNSTYTDGTPITSSTLKGHRVDLIASYNPDLLISVHHNYIDSSSGNGTEALYFYGFNQELARTVSDKMAAVSGMKNRGGKYQNVFVLRTHDFMSILLECGFLSNVKDADWLSTEGNTEKLADAIVSGVVNYFS